MKWITLFAVVSLVGCGGGSSSSSSTNNPTTPSSAAMQAGQWEFVATPSSSSEPVYVEVNLAGSNAAIGSTVYNTSLFQFGGGIGGQFSDCGNWETSNQVGTSNSFSGTLSSPGSTPPLNQVTYTGTLASNGQTFSNGSYSAPDSSLCLLASNNS